MKPAQKQKKIIINGLASMKHTVLIYLLLYTTQGFSEGVVVPKNTQLLETTTNTTEDITPHKKPSEHYVPHSVTEVIDKAKDEQPVTLSGKIIRRIKAGVYLFRDNSGDIPVYFDADEIPKNGMRFYTPAAITGEVDRQPKQPVRVDADNIVFVF